MTSTTNLGDPTQPNESSLGETFSTLLDDLVAKYPDSPSAHPLADLFPFPSKDDFDQLVIDIKANGLCNKISLVNEQIFDGRTRYFACREAGVEPETEQWTGSNDLLADVISLNLKRRHLSESQRALIAAKLIPTFRQLVADAKNADRSGTNGANLHRTKKAATERAAKTMKVSERSVQHAEKVLASGRPDLISRVEAGELAVSRGEKEVQHSSANETASCKTIPLPVVPDPEPGSLPHETVSDDSVTEISVPVALNSPANFSDNTKGTSHVLITWPEVEQLLRRAEALIETPSEQLRSKLKVYDPETEEAVMDDDPRFHWTAQDHTEELIRTSAYISALQKMEGKIMYQLSQLRKKKKSLERHHERLTEDQTPPMMGVAKKQPLPGQAIPEVLAARVKQDGA